MPTEDHVDVFIQEAASFLAGWPSRSRSDTFEWGVGSDDVSLFEEADRAVESQRLDGLRAWRRALGTANLSWITGPPAYGGRGLRPEHQTAFDRLARERDVPSSAPLTVSLGIVAPTILAFGSAATKERYLAAMHTADVIACQLFSEPGAGSDLASVATRARRDAGGWRVSGQKLWTSGAHIADIGAALCRSSAGPRHHNLTALLVDMHSPGVEVRPLRQMTGGAAFNEVFLNDVWVPDDHRLGAVDGGWEVALRTLSNERAALGAGGLGGKGLLSVERILALLDISGHTDDPLARQEVAALVSGLRTATWMRGRLAAGGSPGAKSSLLKLALCRDLTRLAGLVSKLLGPKLIADAGEWGTYSWSGFVLGLPGYRIGGGTDEVLKSVIAERVLGLPREPAA
jgi:alkylation response protein AidB-like acyl-CoA dehydrogenase